MAAQSANIAKTSLVDDWDNLPKIPDSYYKYMQQQNKTTMTAKIFELSAPYANPYQSNKPKWLFVCSAGLLRSPTGAAVGTMLGANTRSCGSSNYALIPLSVNLILWADVIFFVNPENYRQAVKVFENTGYEQDIDDKKVVLTIPDDYEAFDPVLEELFNIELKEYLAKSKT